MSERRRCWVLVNGEPQYAEVAELPEGYGTCESCATPFAPDALGGTVACGYVLTYCPGCWPEVERTCPHPEHW